MKSQFGPNDITSLISQSVTVFSSQNKLFISKLANFLAQTINMSFQSVRANSILETPNLSQDVSFTDENYMNSYRNFRPEPFIERSMDMELWSRIKLILKTGKYYLKSGKYYTEILNDIVFKNLDYVKDKVL